MAIQLRLQYHDSCFALLRNTSPLYVPLYLAPVLDCDGPPLALAIVAERAQRGRPAPSTRGGLKNLENSCRTGAGMFDALVEGPQPTKELER
jgi:hypothetical protein